ncbi:hypothetical protein LCGC14_3092660, partial [marine sediment metagenome]
MRKDHITEYIKYPMIIIEFGSYDATDTILYKNYFQKASVYGIEPDLFMYQFSKNRVKGRDISMFHYAITNKTGMVDFYESKFTIKTAGMQIGDPSFAGSLG